jgi:hypothetical protein
MQLREDIKCMGVLGVCSKAADSATCETSKRALNG